MARGFGTTWGAGTDDVIEYPSFSTPQKLTIFAYVYQAGDGGNGQGRILGSGTGFGTWQNQSTTTLRITPRWTGGTAKYDYPRPSLSTWHAHLITYDGSQPAGTKPKVYVDGTVQTVTTVSASSGTFPANANHATRLGNNASVPGTRNWDGMITRFAIWNRILSAGERTALFNGVEPVQFANGLLEYDPLVNSARSLTLGTPTKITGTAVQAEPPGVKRLFRQFGGLRSVPPAGGVVVPWHLFSMAG